MLEVAIVVTLGAALARALEIFLSEAQKRSVDRAVFLTWNTLDDLKRVSLLAWLQRAASWRLIFAPLSLSAIFLWWAHMKAEHAPDIPSPYPWYFLMYTGAALIGFVMISRALNSASLTRAFVKISIYAIICLAPLYIFLFWTQHNLDTLTPSGEVALIQMMFVIVFVTVTLFTALVLIYWTTIAAPVMLLYGFSAALHLVEFIVRRLYEYPRGPVIAVGILLTAALTILKISL